MSADPAAVPLPVALGIPTLLFFVGAVYWLQSRRFMDDGTEQIFHGVWMSLWVLPLGAAISHAKIPAAMSLVHGVSLLQGVFLIAIGSIWFTHLGFKQNEKTSFIAKWCMLWGFWSNTFGILWGAVTGAKDLFFKSKSSVPFQAPELHETILHILLKFQGICTLIAFLIILHQMSKARRN